MLFRASISIVLPHPLAHLHFIFYCYNQVLIEGFFLLSPHPPFPLLSGLAQNAACLLHCPSAALPSSTESEKCLPGSAAKELCLVMQKPAPNAIWLIEMLAFPLVTRMCFPVSLPLDLVSFNFQAETLDFIIVKSLEVKSERSVFCHCELCDAMLWLSIFISGDHAPVNLQEYGPVPAQGACICW